MTFETKQILNREEWEVFFDEVQPHTFLQTWTWSLFQEMCGNEVFRLGIYKDGIIAGIAFAFLIKAKRGTFLFCPHGPIILKQNIQFTSQIVESLFSKMKNIALEKSCSFIRISPLMEDSEENKALFLKLGFRNAPIHMMHPEHAWILDISKDEDKLLSEMRKSTRYSIQKAKKDGVRIIQDFSEQSLQNFWELYSKTASRQNFTPFSFRYLENEFDTYSKENKIALFLAKFEGKIVSSAVVIFEKHSAFYHHGASDYSVAKTTASHLVLWDAILEAKKRDCHFFNFWGIVSEEQKNHPWAGISIFKKGFGGFDEKYLHCQDYMLKKNYYINYFIETIRRKWRRL